MQHKPTTDAEIFYTPEEIEALRAQLRRGNEMARDVAKRLGLTLHPKLTRLKEKQSASR